MKQLLYVIILFVFLPLTSHSQKLFKTMDRVIIDNSHLEMLNRHLGHRVTFRGQ